jgi:hypothetical protein
VNEISFHRLKVERCARLAKDEPEADRRLELETERTLWLELADAEEHLDEVRKKVQNHLNAHRLSGVAFACEPSRQTNPVKGLDLDDPEARQHFIQGKLWDRAARSWTHWALGLLRFAVRIAGAPDRAQSLKMPMMDKKSRVSA